MGKKTKKAGKGKEKTERKTAKAEEKRARRDAKKVSEEDDIDSILRSIQKEEAKKKEVHVEENVPAPSPRSNCSLNINPLKDTELILYGGEFYNGKKTFVYGDLYRYDVEKNQWKLVSSPNSPPPRSAHQAVAWKDHIYIFGGEFTSPNQERFHHYKYKWQEIKPRPGSMWPSARSGFQLFVFQDEIFLYGGYSKEVANDKSGSEKGIVHSDLWSLDPRTWEWNKAKKNGMPPGPRAGFSTCVHKKRAVFFGGVVDMETEGDVIMSLFMNELYGFQLDTRRWYPLELRKDKPTKTKLKGKKENGLIKGSQDDMELSETIGGDETMDIDEEEIETEYESKEVSNHMIKTLSLNNNTSRKIPDVKVQGLVGDSPMQTGSLSEAVKPCGRINSCMVVAKDMLYLYGGMMEVNDKEISLDDLYSLNLSKLDEWKCLIPASESEWLEVSEEEEDEDDDDEDEEENSDASSEGTDDDGDDGMECPEDCETTLDMGTAVSIIKGETKNLRRKEKRARIEQIRVSLGLSDSQRTPVPGESLKDFYRRTCMYWQMAAHEHTQHTGKELRKDGFDLAEARFKELKPILDELAVLEAEQKAEEETAAETSSRKRVNKKSSQKKPGK